MNIASIFISLCTLIKICAFHNFILSTKTLEIATGLSETISGLNPTHLVIFNNNESYFEEVDSLVNLIHKRYYKSVIFSNINEYLRFIEKSLQKSIESFSLIFCEPYELSKVIHKRKLAHRLNLFIFYWGSRHPPNNTEVQFSEPMRAVVITRPREKAQITPAEAGTLQLVNWYDAKSLGLHRTPLIPSPANVYTNLGGRVLRIPVFHSPPWFWVNYENDTLDDNINNEWEYDLELSLDSNDEVNVTGGRDHRLLTLLAASMNFNFVYINIPGRTQGSLKGEDDNNVTFTGGIGLLQEQKADMLLGDVSLSWERRKAVEFSFFTLADSGAFVTHAPRRLNEALAILRPFKTNVWPYLILTLAVSGPMLYLIIVIPHKVSFQKNKLNGMPIYVEYLNEITQCKQGRRVTVINANFRGNKKLPKNMLDRCIWFTVQLFLKQSCSEPYSGYRAKFLMIVFWIAATYVLADVYSAQLTSQFARPAHEPPINDLQKLHKAILHNGYRLYVEKDSSSLEMLQNGTEIFRNLYALMKQQMNRGYLIDSVESGIKLIADGLENKVVLGGRETLYFNMKQFGSKTFQLSQKLYTRYSAVAVQLGCPFLDSLNEVLIRLFEGGILDKITNAEYEALSRLVNVNVERSSLKNQEALNNNADANKDNKKDKNESSNYVIQPINLRMLQGAFIALVFGYGFAGFIFTLEMFFASRHAFLLQKFKSVLKRRRQTLQKRLKQYCVRCFVYIAYLLRLVLRKN